jgi:hypothetical protein
MASTTSAKSPRITYTILLTSDFTGCP